MNAALHNVLAAAALALAAPAFAQITFYEHEGFRGRVHTTNGALDSFAGWSFNDRASSVVVDKGRWELCEDVGFKGRCAVLRPGSYEQLGSMGLNDRLSSARPANANTRYANEAPPPMAHPNYAYRQRPSERLFEVPVTSVRAVLGSSDQRCWVERQSERDGPNAERAIIGHQRGGGDGRACESTSNDAPDHWDVGYNFRGISHRVQMNASPRQTITINRDGEPRM